MHFLGCWHALGPTPPDLSVFPEGRTTHSALHMGGGMQTPPPPHPQGPLSWVTPGSACLDIILASRRPKDLKLGLKLVVIEFSNSFAMPICPYCT